MATFRRRTPCLGAVLENTLKEHSSSGFVVGQSRYFCTDPRKFLTLLSADFQLPVSAPARRGRSILIVDPLTSLGALGRSLGFVGRLFAGVFDIAPGVL